MWYIPAADSTRTAAPPSLYLTVSILSFLHGAHSKYTESRGFLISLVPRRLLLLLLLRGGGGGGAPEMGSFGIGPFLPSFSLSLSLSPRSTRTMAIPPAHTLCALGPGRRRRRRQRELLLLEALLLPSPGSKPTFPAMTVVVVALPAPAFAAEAAACVCTSKQFILWRLGGSMFVAAPFCVRARATMISVYSRPNPLLGLSPGKRRTRTRDSACGRRSCRLQTDQGGKKR